MLRQWCGTIAAVVSSGSSASSSAAIVARRAGTPSVLCANSIAANSRALLTQQGQALRLTERGKQLRVGLGLLETGWRRMAHGVHCAAETHFLGTGLQQTPKRIPSQSDTGNSMILASL